MCELPKALSGIVDARKEPRIPTERVVRSSLVMLLCRLGSLNALEQVKLSPFVRSWLGASLPSADSIGRICDLIDPGTLRRANHDLYACLKRSKAIQAPWHGLLALVLDGHESHASYRRHCDGCLERVVQTTSGPKTQYYHRAVWAMLVARDFDLLLDCEPQRPGEDEVATALRLLERLIVTYPRAFDVVLADAIYTDPRLYRLVLGHGKEVLTVLKENQPGLLQEARSLSELCQPVSMTDDRKKIDCWDLEGFTPWSELGKPLRVLRTRETTTVQRQLDGNPEERLSEWFWLTTLDRDQAGSRAAVEIGHSRWTIENHGFNEIVNEWHANHIYKHQPAAILAFALLCILAFNLFHTFFARNLKPALRQKVTKPHVVRCLVQELYAGLSPPLPLPP